MKPGDLVAVSNYRNSVEVVSHGLFMSFIKKSATWAEPWAYVLIEGKVNTMPVYLLSVINASR